MTTTHCYHDNYLSDRDPGLINKKENLSDRDPGLINKRENLHTTTI